MLPIGLRQPQHLPVPKPHQLRCFSNLDPAVRQIAQNTHPIDLRAAHRNHRHRP
jgi:hypothetical protein